MLGSAELGVLLFLAQVMAGYLCAALLARLGPPLASKRSEVKLSEARVLRLDSIIAQAADLCKALRLCPVLPDAGRRSRGSAALRRGSLLRDAAGSLLWL